MKILKDGISGNTVIPKSPFAGWKGTCKLCGATVELEDYDTVLSYAIFETKPYRATVKCPTQGCAVSRSAAQKGACAIIMVYPPKDGQ